MKKMILIGAGSMCFTQGLVNDLLNTLHGASMELALCDIDETALEAVTGLVRKMIAARNPSVSLRCDTDRTRLLPGCDYVVCTIGVGGRRAWEQDVFIPRRYGVFQPVGDTAMPGGISRAMRMVPALLDILADVGRLCPGAMVFNYSNPMAVLTRAVMKAGAVPVAGLCHGVGGTEHYLAEALGVPRERLTSRGVGINHLTFLYDLRDGGEDLKPRMHAYYRRMLAGGAHPPEALGEPFSWEIFERFDAFPAPGDRHITEFFTECFPEGQYYGKTLGYEGAFSFENVVAEGDAQFERTRAISLSDESLPEDFFMRMSGEHEQLLSIIDSIEHDRRRIFSVNLPNGGAVPNLPADAVLELPAAACAGGFRKLCCDDFPSACAAVVARFLAIVEVTAEAALRGERRLFEEAILMGGYISDRQAVSKMTDELLRAQKQYLPQF